MIDTLMNDGKNKNIGLGLIFGVVAGIVIGPMIFDDPSTGVGLGISLGLVYGAAFSQHKDEKPTEGTDDNSNK